MRKIRFNRHTFLSMIAMCATFTSCTSSEDFSPDVQPGVQDEGSDLTCETAAKEFAGPESRSSLSLSLQDEGMAFKWDSGDAITVFADGADNAEQIYYLSAGVGTPQARFHTDNFTMTENKLYYAFSRKNGDSHVEINGQNDITVDYDGQTQIANANTTHLGAYDFLAAGTLCEDPSSVHFKFEHFGATLRLVMYFSAARIADADEKIAINLREKDEAQGLSPVYFTELEIFDKKNTFCQTKRQFSFDQGKTKVNVEGVEKDAYSFNFANTPTGDVNRFKLRIGAGESLTDGGITRFESYQDGSGANTYGQLVTYIEVPPHTFTYDIEHPANHSPLSFLVKGYYEKKLTDGSWEKIPVSYVFERKVTDSFDAGRAYQLSFTMNKPEEFNVTLNVNHTWQHGDALDDTTVSPAKLRAKTGDPGYDKELNLPKYIYYIYCYDGKVVLPSYYDINAKAVTKITADQSSDWRTTRREPDHNDISRYIGNDGALNGVVTLTKYKSDEPGHESHAGDCTYHLYVVASQSELTLPVAVGQDEESVVRALTYSIPASGAQVFMRDLYSTPWDATNFEGNLTAKEKDIYLYHVAAMVDVKWNSDNAINKVSAQNVKDADLFLFKPTENTYSAGSYTVTNNITDEDQKYLGRTVFYLPQFQKTNCKYNIGFNDAEATEIQFIPDVTKGYTSWLRWLKKY